MSLFNDATMAEPFVAGSTSSTARKQTTLPPRLTSGQCSYYIFVKIHENVQHSLRMTSDTTMSRLSISTPCPPPYAQSSLPVPVAGRRSSIASAQDDTEEIDYTRAFHVGIQNGKPRRRSTLQPREKRDAGITIFEDVLEDQELVVESKPQIAGNTLLGKRAQRMPGRGILKKQDRDADVQQQPQATLHSRRRLSIAFQPTIAEWDNEVADENTAVNGPAEKRAASGLTKEPRRRTIFVPPDDTTMLTIHPGANTANRLNDTFQLPDLAVKPVVGRGLSQLALESNAQQPAKRPRMSLAAAPKRIPLQQVAIQEANVQGVDMFGQNGGKENMPPNASEKDKPGHKSVTVAVNFEKSTAVTSSLFKQTAATTAKQSTVARNAVPFSKPIINGPRRHSVMAERSENATGMAKAKPNRLSMMPCQELKHESSPTSDVPSDDNRSRQHKARPLIAERKVARLQQYPVLSEDLAQPELYEDSWLGHQEVALTELINQIFNKAKTVHEPWQRPGKGMRERLINIYHQQSVTTLHKRLRASLLYGALSRPKDAPRPPNPALDIGLRKRFLSLWLDTYDQEALHTAAEVVFGRQLPRRQLSTSGATEGILDPHKNRRTLIGFLETFLVEVDDAEEPDEERGDDPNGRWRKMILRSFMLVWLLDQAKVSGIVHGCLFKPMSGRKSSVSVLNALVGMFNSSIGDVTRILRHLDYEVSHTQDPLDEVEYHIQNMAVDLRDGILLTRLVELLVFAPKKTTNSSTDFDATVTVRMPDLTILESALFDADGSQCPMILSQHLKMPCLGRAQKVFNAEVAISALHDHGRLGYNGLDISAEDIVDGHREKTLSLLWSLVSTHGLEQLVDFRELAADLKRTTINASDVETPPSDYSRLSQLQQESLLKKWASAHCARNGLRISNLTTSFADGKAYATILDAFAGYMHIKTNHGTASPKADRKRLVSQLHAFGCSNAFIKQLVSANGTIPSRNTTISNLAFLASRLLPLARQRNAAILIQRAFRLRRLRTTVSQRIALMRLAHGCATVVQMQNRLVSAAVVLQRSWRQVLDGRIRKLNHNAERFQAIAKSWLERRRIQRAMSGLTTSSQPLRVMGGW